MAKDHFKDCRLKSGSLKRTLSQIKVGSMKTFWQWLFSSETDAVFVLQLQNFLLTATVKARQLAVRPMQ